MNKMIKMKLPKAFLLAVACLLPFMILFVSGLSIYHANRNEITFTIPAIILPLSGIFLGVSLAIFFLLLAFRRNRKASLVLAGIVAGLSLAVWVQGQLLLWNFGQFNGQVIPWGRWKSSMLIDALCWSAAVGISLWFFLKRDQKKLRTLITGIYLLGFFSIIIGFITAPRVGIRNYEGYTIKDVFTFHTEKNVIVILMDMFQSDFFEEFAAKYPEEIRELDGFTFYRNTISRFPTTKVSVPSILTGTVFLNEMPYQEFVLKSYADFNLIDAYSKRSWNSCAVGQLKSVFPGMVSMDDFARVMNHDYSYRILEYLDFSCFRSMPTIVKKSIYRNGHWFFSGMFRKQYPPEEHGGDLKFLELFERNAAVDPGINGSFKFFHFVTPHLPLCLDRNLRYNPDLIGEDGYREQARGALKIIGRVLKKLKDLDIYDKAEIVIMSDHGTGRYHSAEVWNGKLDTVSNLLQQVETSSMALFLHKPAGAHGKLVPEDAPLEVTDLACLLGIRNADSSCSGFRAAMSGKERDRTYYFYQWDNEYWASFYMPPITGYRVTGPVRDPGSFSPMNVIYTDKGITVNPAVSGGAYTLGTEVLFTIAGNNQAEPYVRSGWFAPEVYNMWSVGPVSELAFTLNKWPGRDLVLRLQAFAYLANGKLPCQVVNIYANHIPAGRWLVKDKQWYEAVIPQSSVPGKTVNLTFRISNPTAPSDISDSKDIRKLGIGIVSMILDEKR
jgi:hypothetical protein